MYEEPEVKSHTHLLKDTVGLPVIYKHEQNFTVYLNAGTICGITESLFYSAQFGTNNSNMKKKTNTVPLLNSFCKWYIF